MIGDQEEKGESSRRKRESRAGGKGRVEQEEKGGSSKRKRESRLTA